jgi:hypothetical protein
MLEVECGETELWSHPVHALCMPLLPIRAAARRFRMTIPFPGDLRHSIRMTSTERSRVAGLETRSIDYVPLSERHGKVWHLERTA